MISARRIPLRARRLVAGLFLALACLPAAWPVLAERARLELRHVTLDLPGLPAKLIPTDLDGDGRVDLVAVVAYSEVGQISEDRVEDMIQVSRVIPVLYDRREVRFYRVDGEGGYRLACAPLPLPRSVLHLELAPAPLGMVALTDDGLSALRYEPGGAEPTLGLEPLVEREPLLARTGSFYPTLELVHDLDGDGRGDLLLPTRDRLEVYRIGEAGVSAEPTWSTDGFARETRSSRFSTLSYPLPEVRDVDGDGLPDLVFGSASRQGPAPLHVYLGTGGGRFAALRREALDCHDVLTDLRIRRAPGDDSAGPWPTHLMAFRDLDGDGRAEAVMREERPRGDSLRKELKDAKRPIQDLAFHRLGSDLQIEAEPYFEARIVGHTLEGSLDEEDAGLPFGFEQFSDLDGDGREDLITITLDFSIFQAVRIMATKRISIGVDFHVYAQHADGSFHEVEGLDLSEKLRFDLNDLSLGRFAQFAGDFDGDGRQDFVHLGRGKTVTVHRGGPGCRYPARPDLTLELEQEPDGLELVRIEDLDGDGRSDLRVTRPLPSQDPDATGPVRLELYLSGPGR